MVIPTCLQCHASEFEGKLIIGLGNTTVDFSNTTKADFSGRINMLRTMAPKQYEAAAPFLTAFATTYPLMETEVRGVNTADRLAALLAAHRHPKTLQWSDTPMLTAGHSKKSSICTLSSSRRTAGHRPAMKAGVAPARPRRSPTCGRHCGRRWESGSLPPESLLI